MRFTVLSLMLICSDSWADDYLQLWCCSSHFDRTTKSGREYNERNYGIGLSKETEYGSLVIGTYDNSHSRRSAYAGLEVELIKSSSFVGSLMLGGVSGYGPDEAERKRLRLVLIPAGHFVFKGWRIDLVGMPFVTMAVGISFSL